MRRKILLVENDEIERTMQVAAIDTEYDVLEAEDTREATLLLQQKNRSIAAIVVSMIPEQEAYETLRRIRENAVWSQIPVLALIGETDKEVSEKALSLGVIGFISKPYSLSMLLGLLKNCIHLRETAAIGNSMRRDKLTGLYNRDGFFKEAERRIASQKPGTYIMSSYDIDNFKVINDQYGTETGDAVLKYVAECISSCASEIDGISCRYTADKHAMLYPANKKDSETAVRARKIVTRPPCIDRTIRLRIGRYLIEDTSLSVNSMLDRATLAEESIRGKYSETVAEYNESMRGHLIHNQEIINEMHQALENGEFEPWFQPQYNHATGAIIGSEALVRWRHPEKGLISPCEFIPIFERNGFIYEMDKNIWEQVCQTLRRWIDEGREPLPISVNISRYDVFVLDFIEVITGLIKKYDLPIHLLRLEITESAFSETSGQIVAIICQLIELGFTVEIDDFGSGYSSLNTLKDVPAQILKLDMKFLEKDENSQRGGNILESIVRMAKWLGMAVIAEGVEQKEQADYLKSIGCHYIQGYYYAKPMPLENYEKLVATSIKEAKLSRLKTVDTYHNMSFWDPKSLDTLVFNHFSGGAFIFEYKNEHYEMLRVNNEFVKTFGSELSEEEILRMEPFLELEEKEKQAVVATIKRAFHSDEAESCEIYSTMYSKPGNGEYVRLTVRRIASNEDRIMFYGYADNITAQRIAEKKERESASQIRSIMQSVNGGVSAVTFDEEGKICVSITNNRYYELFGYTKEQADEENLDVLSLILEEDREKTMEMVREMLLHNHQDAIFDYRCRKRDGSLVYIRCNASLTEMDGIGHNVITSVCTDITQQMLLEQKERELTERLSVVMENMYGGVSAVCLREGKTEFVFYNKRYYEMLGYTKEQFETEKPEPFSFIYPEDRERTMSEMQRLLQKLGTYTMEYRIVCRDGSIRWLQNRIVTMHLVGMEEPVCFSISNDITSQREAEERERKVNHQLQSLLKDQQNKFSQ